MAEEKFTDAQANAGLAQMALNVVENDAGWSADVMRGAFNRKRIAAMADALRKYIAGQWGAENWDEIDPVEFSHASRRAQADGLGGDAAWRACEAACELYALEEDCECAATELAQAVCELCGLPEEVAGC